MEAFSLLLDGIGAATSLDIFGATIIGILAGLVIGALPGLGPAAGVAIMLPIAVTFGGSASIACLGGVYYGAMFGGAVTSILLGIPGDAPSVMTILDGHPLAKKGEAGRALGMAVFASFIGGFVGLMLLTVLALPISKVAIAFGPIEMTAIMVFALSLVSVLGGRNAIKGFVALGLGFWLGTVGIDPIAGPLRYTFGSIELLEGIDFSVVAVGLFGLTAMFESLSPRTTGSAPTVSLSQLFPRLKDAVVSRWQLVSGAFLGFFVGVLPGVGATAATMLSYAVAKRTTKNAENFGHGEIKGVAAPEAANNSASYASMIPLFTLGIPGSATTAVMMGGLIMLGLQPGPLLFVNDSEFVWTVFGSFYVGNLSLVFLTLLLTPLLASILLIKPSLLYPAVLTVVVFGVFTIEYSMWSVTVALAAGALGLILMRLDYPAVPLILGLVLGPLLERNVRRTLISSEGDLTAFVTSPIAGTLYALTLLVILLPLVKKQLQHRRQQRVREA
ncbi:MAG: tripartite tricarboxylate transporter permease [Candidatus Wenzhouxiangella sp. M2_3B_020]